MIRGEGAEGFTSLFRARKIRRLGLEEGDVGRLGRCFYSLCKVDLFDLRGRCLVRSFFSFLLGLFFEIRLFQL